MARRRVREHSHGVLSGVAGLLLDLHRRARCVVRGYAFPALPLKSP